MGMLLEPVNKIDDFHVNWTGWHYIRGVLYLVDADDSEMAGSNDGDLVDEETAKEWGEVILKILPNLYDFHVPDKSFQGGYRNVPMIAKDVSELMEIALTKSKPYELDKWTKVWLQEFAEFCIKSGGFYQY